MKITIVLLFVSYVIMGQTKREIANVYFKKAEKSMEKIDYEAAKNSFDKGVKVLDSITTKEVAQQGAFIYYELKYYEKAKEFAKLYFNLSTNKTSENYMQMLELYVDMEEKIQEKKNKEQELLTIKKAKERELKRIDSLKGVWREKEGKFTLKLDSLYSFNKKGVALFTNKGFFGLINDQGDVTIEPDTYLAVLENEGYFVFMDKKDNPENIFIYNSNTDKSIAVVKPYIYKDDLTGYGKVTLPRGNGRLVMYVDDLTETLVYDITEEKFVRIANVKDFLKAFKKSGKIDKYDVKEKTVKIAKDWYLLGNHLGGQVYSLHSVESQELNSFLFAGNENEESKIIEKTKLGFVSAYYTNKLVAVKSNGEELWLTNEGSEASKPILNNKYKGKTKVVKVNKGYQLVKDGSVFLKDEVLEKLPDFLRKNKS